MSIIYIRDLATTELKDIVHCLTLCFDNYFVQLPSDTSYWKERFRCARVDYSLSFGAFDENLLVGFIIIGVDSRNEKLTAFNTGTGVLPSYRGRKIVDMLFAHAFPLFISRGITHCGLEVIQDNTRARHVYERIGFAVSRTFLCFRGTLPAVSSVATLHPQSLKSCSIDLSSFQRWAVAE